MDNATSRADLILSADEIVTVDPLMSTVEAVAIQGGRILATGSRKAMLEHADAHTKIHELPGRTVFPGFVEAHGHPLLTGLSRGDPTVDIRAVNIPSFDAAMATVRRRAAKTTPGEFILFFGLDPQLHEGMHEPSIDELDRLAPDNPVAVQTSNFHVMFLNQKALTHFNLTPQTKDPTGGKIHRAADGKPTGKLEEKATRLVLEPYWAALGEERAEREFDVWLWKHARGGYTTTAELGISSAMFPLLDRLLTQRDAPVRIVGYQMALPDGATITNRDHGDDRFRMVGIKLIADGSPFAGNIWVSRPYLNTQMTLKGMALGRDHTGHMNWTPEEIGTIIDRYASEGWQIAVHVQGDRTFDVVLDAFEAAITRYDLKDHRFRIEHCALPRPEHIARAVKLGVTFSFFLSHLYYWGEALRDGMFGEDRAAQYMPIGSALRAGMDRVSVHCDAPMTDPDVVRCLHLAVNRRTEKGAVIGPEQTIPVDDAIRAVTIHAAWQLQMDDRVGSIEAGKYADFTVLDCNPRRIARDSMMDVRVLETWLGGKRVWPEP
ncbi:amidohydrolase family protein [Acidiphilium sp. AL]|uniref:amidohydrolase n=1 Tax=Acidiphilium sp. AL TaxID=2871704 RepID=UPI0021CB46B2|nr:amidohydrolase [Acidiphilium sp. AL]MCU4162031.1 amidohydrolase family protein [Acidiphilium sp. AL]